MNYLRIIAATTNPAQTPLKKFIAKLVEASTRENGRFYKLLRKFGAAGTGSESRAEPATAVKNLESDKLKLEFTDRFEADLVRLAVGGSESEEVPPPIRSYFETQCKIIGLNPDTFMPTGEEAHSDSDKG